MTLLHQIERKLTVEGFRPFRHNPFFDWMRSQPLSYESVAKTRNTLYIANPPIPKTAPFDFSMVTINLECDDKIAFDLSIYFRDVLVDALEGDEIKAVHNEHDWKWHESLRVYFSDIASRFKLIWDVEYDETIEDCLWGHFALDKAPEIISLMRAIRNAYHEFTALKG